MEKILGNDATLINHLEKDLVNDANGLDNILDDANYEFGEISELESDNDENDDSGFFVELDNMLVDINVDMQDFEMNIDKVVEWVGDSSNTMVDEGTHDEDVQVINTDVFLNKLCETFNGKLNDGRDKPIITCLEFIKEYLVNVEKAIGKTIGPLTPTTMQTL